jgi:drug/metabolite transporter (DMT)-like permease
MVEGKKSPISSSLVLILMGGMIVTGSINTVANKLQNNSKSLDLPYQHAWFITFCMFLGEILCIFMYLIKKLTVGKDEILEENMITESGEVLKETSPFLLAIPALCDFFGSTLMTFGLTMMAPSVYQMFRGSLIFFTALFSVIFLKNKLYRHNYLAMVIVISGLIMVGLASQVFPAPIPDGRPKGSETKNSFWGIILVVIAQVFSATQFIVEEKFMKGYHCDPLKAVGWEGIWGASLYAIILIIFQFIPCDPDASITKMICAPNDKGEWWLEDTAFAFKQIGNNGLLMFFVILYICSIAIFNYVGISVAKYASSPARAVVDTVRTIVVWGFFLMPFIYKCDRESFNWLQLVGFIFLVLGTVIYNEVLVLPFLGLNMYTKKAIKEKEDAEKLGNHGELNPQLFNNNSTIS